MPVALPPLPDDIARIAGPILLGYLFHWGLFGVLSVQIYTYHVSFPNDSRVTKSLVYFVYCIEVAQTIILTHDCWKTYAEGFGNLAAVDSTHLIWLAVPVFVGIVSCPVQMYYAYRVYVLSRSRVLYIVICVIALLQGSSAIAEGVAGFQIGNFHDLARLSFVSCSIWLAGSAACDFIITCSMVYLLLKRNSRIPETHTTIIRLVQLIVETGMLTACAALLELILFLGFPNDSFHATVAFILAKLYSNSLLVLFNNRKQISRSGPSSHQFSLPRVGGSHSEGSTNISLPKTSIRVERSTYVDVADDGESIPLEDRTGKKVHSLSPDV